MFFGAGSAGAAIPGENGPLLMNASFTDTYGVSRNRIFELRLDGGVSLFARSATNFNSVAVSPNGGLLASSRNPGDGMWLGPKSDLFAAREISDPDYGATDPELAGFLTVETSPVPAVSPDGRILVYSSQIDGEPAIQMIRLADGATWELPVGVPAKLASFSPDGGQLVFVGLIDGRWRLCVSRVDGSQMDVLASLTEAVSGPVFSPDGSKIAYTEGYPDNERIAVLDLTTGSSSTVTAPGEGWQIWDWARKRLFGIRSYSRRSHVLRVTVYNPGTITVRGASVRNRTVTVRRAGTYRVRLRWKGRRTISRIRVRFKPEGALPGKRVLRIRRK